MLKEKILNQDLISASKTDTVVPFQLVPGGKDGDENWLGALEVGTYFLSRAKGYKGEELLLHQLVHRAKLTCLLLVQDAKGDVFRRHVDTLRFSRANEKVEELGVSPDNPPEQEQEQGATNDSPEVQP